MSNAKKPWWHNSKSRAAIFSFVMATGIISAYFAFAYVEKNFIKPKLIPKVDAPKELSIPIINVSALVQVVGIDKNGRMGLPTNFVDVGWYKYGPRPGERGSAVIAGHLDTAQDDKAVFAKLSLLKKGDDVYVLDETGRKIHFRVAKKEVYDDTKAPLDRIFDQTTTTARLNLITCDGVWNPKTKNYSERLVVYSERVLD
ncbi:MAG: Peptidase C60 sortase A and B [Parcubacteria group bacterium GW2011_GWA2_47_16]|nr:MAG: Peptidase C60 sortase A and B [Parcubacteria group bacterium GW2011_GWA2_47_16]